jgi:hypothetical protein
VTDADDRRHLVPAEVAAVIAVAIVSIAGAWPDRIPVVLPLFAAASVFRWWRGRSWGEVWRTAPGYPLIACGVGVAALLVGVIAGTPVIEALSDRAVQWSTYPLVRGSATNLIVVAVLVATIAVTAELVFHGWLVERILELAPRNVAIAVMLGGVAEAIVMPGDFASRVGAGLFGAGLGWMYVASGRTVAATIPARVVFSVGAVVLESLRVIG